MTVILIKVFLHGIVKQHNEKHELKTYNFQKISTKKNTVVPQIKISPHEMAKSKHKRVSCIFKKSLDLVLCIIFVVLCIVNIPRGQSKSKLVKKGHIFPM